MGHGAPKNIAGIPTNLMVACYVGEGLLEEALRFLNHNLKKAFEEPDNPDVWKAITLNREKVFQYTKQYTQAVMAVERHMNKA